MAETEGEIPQELHLLATINGLRHWAEPEQMDAMLAMRERVKADPCRRYRTAWPDEGTDYNSVPAWIAAVLSLAPEGEP